MKTSNIIIGCGEVGKRIAQILIQKGEVLTALSHQKSSQMTLKQQGINYISANLDNPDSLLDIDFQHSDIYYLAPPPNAGETDTRMQNLISAISQHKPPHRIVYISTTGVYGDASGEWVTENNPPAPQASRSKRRLDAETCLTRYCQQSGCEYNILRVSGIYCLSKLPLDRLKAGVLALDIAIAPSSNRIHADDLANICIAAMTHETSNQIFNVADGNPTSITDYFMQVSKAFDLPPPTQISWQEAQSQISEAMLSYLAESKKISIEKLKNTLEISLQFPDLETGLKQCVAEYQLAHQQSL